MAQVYRHRRKDTLEVFYVGISTREHRPYEIENRNKWWSNIYNKVGRTVEIISTNLSWDDACELEMFLIAEYGRKDLGLGNLVNMTDGGEGVIGRVVSDETKKKMSISQLKLKKKASKKTIEKLRVSHLGIKPVNRLKVNQYNLDGEFIKTWDSITDAYKFLNKNNGSKISAVCKGKRNSAYKYKWKYYGN